MQKPDTLIRTKLRIPYIRPDLVPRQRLKEQVMRGLQCPLTLITAPAGFGKTTLVASSVTDRGIPVAWLSVDKDDNQQGRFLTYLVAAFQQADDRIGGEAAQLVAGIQQPVPEAVLTSLINSLELVGAEIALVLDDYQLISTPIVHESVSFLLEHCPRTFHLVIASRSDPPLPLARLRVRGQALELRADDLRFSEGEAAQFLNEIMGLQLDAGAIATLEKRTEGWIAGLQMAALSMRDRKNVQEFIEGFSGTHRYILDYLLEEVLASQPPQIQQFLLYTSILERLTAPLCDVLMAGEESLASVTEKPEIQIARPFASQSAVVLDYLDRQNLFLVSLDDERTWFRYHHLFADLLRARLQQVKADGVYNLHIIASSWLEQNGLIPEAIHHLLEAGEEGQAADLIERYGPLYWAQNNPSIMQMADTLTREMVVSHPKMGLYQACLHIIQGRIANVSSLLDEIERVLNVMRPDTGKGWMQTMIRLARAFLASAVRTSEPEPLPGFEILDEIPDEEPILQDAADILYGMTLRRRGEIDRAAEASEKSVRRLKKENEDRSIPTIVSFLARAYLMQGRLHAAASLCREYLIPGREGDIRFITSGVALNVTLGEVLFEWNYVEEGEKHIRDGLEANKPWQNIMTDGFGLSALARVLRSKGDYLGVMQVVDRFEEKLCVPSRPGEFDADFYTLRARTLLAFGRLKEASRWAEQVLLSEGYHQQPELFRLTLARIYLAQGRYGEIEGILCGEESRVAYGNRIARRLESILLCTLALAGQSRLAQAYGLIESCLSLGEAEGYIQTFLEIGEPARALLTSYLRSEKPVHEIYARTVMQAFQSPANVRSADIRTPGLIETLTEREIEVLNLIALGKTNKEIAQHLIVATGTVKAHAATIFRKLDVTNRTEAIARARELGILS
jgi:LuxR family maltose regulon positive regulatory protein